MPSTSDILPPKISVANIPDAGRIRISASPTLPPNVWFRVSELCGAAALAVAGRTNEFTLSWTAAFSILPQIGRLRSAFGFSIELDGPSTERFRKFQEERKAVAKARSATETRQLDNDQLDEALKRTGFVKRQLKDFQRRDLARLIALPHGANFSVPGAGKTTVALAVHSLTRTPDTVLLVVAPKNAFVAWEETLEECIVPNAPSQNGQPFIRLSGNATTLTDQLLSGALRFLVTYERFARHVDVFTLIFSRRPVHLVLDESHRIKAGVFSQRGQAILSVAALPVRRDILSGTPLPHDISDLVSQLDFLWPGQNTSELLADDAPPKVAFRNLYVRTTKSQLGLTPPRREFIPVGMAPFHAALYAVLRDETLQQLAGIRHSHVDIISARRSVMRLLEASTMPLATVFKIVGNSESIPVSNLIDGLVAEGESNKILKTCDLVRSAVQEGRKIVVWTIFTETILRLEKRLVDLMPLTLYGATPTGDEDDEETREGKIRLFHDSVSHGLLIANPAACSEGISLHTVCHDALYVDRSYNAAHYLQSVDRIHRIGLAPGVETRIRILQTVAPKGIGSIDYSVGRRLLQKMETMISILEDDDIRAMALDEESALDPVEQGVTADDLIDLLEQLSTGKEPAEDEQI
jgi:SNF2 family DNA or RNA helicase